LLIESGAPAAGDCGTPTKPRACWKGAGSPIGSKGYKYSDKALTPNGAKSSQLKPGAAGKSKLAFRAAGATLGLGDLTVLDLPLTARLVGTNGECWQATFPQAGVSSLSSKALKAAAESVP